jgi:hypothetical protein
MIYVTVYAGYSMGSVFSLFPHPLHYEMAEFSTSATLVSHVSTGMEVQRVENQM